MEPNINDADRLLSRIELAVGELQPRDGSNAVLIRDLIAATNGLRSLLGVVRPH